MTHLPKIIFLFALLLTITMCSGSGSSSTSGDSDGTSVIIDGFEFDSSNNLIVPTIKASEAKTQVSGIISSNQSWTKINSPYYITSDVQVADGIILTIDPGVQVYGCCIDVFGELSVVGSSGDKIELFNVSIIAQGYHNPGPDGGTIVNIKHARFYGGGAFSGDASGGSLTLQDSTLVDSIYIALNRPNFSTDISRNIFINGSPMVLQLSSSANINIENNVFFFNKNSGSQTFGVTVSDSNNHQSVSIVHNSFYRRDISNFNFYAVRYNKGSAGLNVDDNFWDTSDINEINELLLDRSIDLEYDGFIDFTTYLNSPHTTTPDVSNFLNNFDPE